MAQLKLDDLNFVEPVAWESEQLHGGLYAAFDADLAADFDADFRIRNGKAYYAAASASASASAAAYSVSGPVYANVNVSAYANADA